MLSALVFIAALALTMTPSSASWVGPNEILHFDTHGVIASTYRDPSTGLFHAIVVEETAFHFFHLAFSPNGTLVYNNTFSGPSRLTHYFPWAVIRGNGHGRLFIVFSGETGPKKYFINMTESRNGGAKWSARTPVVLDTTGVRKQLKDFIYVPETDRLHVFFSNIKNELRVVSKPSESRIFSSEFLVANEISVFPVKALYTLPGSGKIAKIHVMFTFQDIKLMYTSSETNGVTWTTPRLILESDENIALTAAVTNQADMYLSYFNGEGRIDMVRSNDHGLSFSAPVRVTRGELPAASAMALCGTRARPILATLHSAKGVTAEYAVWDLSKGMLPHYKPTPYTNAISWAADSGLECVVDAKTGMLNVSTLMAGYALEGYSLLYYAGESDAIPA